MHAQHETDGIAAFYSSTQSINERTLQVTWHLNADSLHVGGALIQPKLKHKTQAMLPSANTTARADWKQHSLLYGRTLLFMCAAPAHIVCH